MLRRTVALALLAVLLASGLSSSTSQAQPAPDWPSLLFTQVLGGLASPVHVTNARDGTNRLFVVEQAGRVRVATTSGGTWSPLPTPFLDISGRVSSGGERGLLSVAFPPDYANKGWFYVFYTSAGNCDDNLVISRFRLITANVADPNTEQVILSIPHPAHCNHNGGQLAFGPDGMLYIGTGDGGSGGDPANNAQNRTSKLGKLLRIDTESVAPGGTYVIPATNPLLNGTRDEVWAVGLRNPWRFSFDRANGDLWIGDVGQGTREEINRVPGTSPGGENYQWSCWEGFFRYSTAAARCNPLATLGTSTPPVLDYARFGGCVSVTGGHVYRGATFPRLAGVYLYGDYCNGTIWGARMQGGSATNTQLATRPHQISSFGEDEAGTIYVVNPAGTIFAISDLICDQGSGGPNTVPCTPQPATFRSATPATAGW